MDFLWTDGTTPTPGEPLREDVHTEVCVIGGGMAGVLCAAQLTAQGIDNVLLEARRVGEGITKGTTSTWKIGGVATAMLSGRLSARSASTPR